MTTNDFKTLRDFILTKNTYFSNGYFNAFVDGETSSVYTIENGNLKAIFPEDRLGNYFYLRNDPNMKFASKQGYEECGVGRFNFDDTMTVYLVAIVNDADEFELINNLRNTVLSTKELIAIPTAAMWQTENVLIDEMKGFGEKAIKEALKNLKGQTIVKLTLSISKEFIPNKCINNPCKECN